MEESGGGVCVLVVESGGGVVAVEVVSGGVVIMVLEGQELLS